MKAFLLAAGFGERLRPLTDKIPKPLIPVSGIPSICYSLMLLKEAGITDVVCNIHYHPHKIVEFFKNNNNFGFNIDFSFEKEILGTGGGLKQCEKYFNDDDFIVINSDIITDLKLRDVISKYEKSDSCGSVVIYDSEKRELNRTVSVEGENVIDFNNLLNSNIGPVSDYMGIAVLSPLIFKYLDKGFSSIVNTGFIDLIKYHSLTFYEHSGVWEDVGTLESLERINSSSSHNLDLIKKRVIDAFGVDL